MKSSALRTSSPSPGTRRRPWWKVEEAREADLDRILEIEEASFSDPWTRELFLQERRSHLSHLWVARALQGGILGYICFWMIEDQLHILNLAVAPEARRQGIARDLLCRVWRWARRRGASCAFLEVRESNRAARALYERLGFREILRRKNYYSRPREDALVMMRQARRRSSR